MVSSRQDPRTEAVRLTIRLSQPEKAPPVSGVYVIRHAASMRVYIGSSVNIRDRLLDHFVRLTQKRHHSRRLQAVFNSDGPNAFFCGVLEECRPHELLEREQWWLDSTLCYTSTWGFNSARSVKYDPHRPKQDAVLRVKGVDA